MHRRASSRHGLTIFSQIFQALCNDHLQTTKHHFHASRNHVFSKQPAILSFCFTRCLTCAARITMKNRHSPSQPFPQDNFMCWKSSFAYPVQKFVCFKCHHCNGEYTSLRGYNTTGHRRHNFRLNSHGTLMEETNILQ